MRLDSRVYCAALAVALAASAVAGSLSIDPNALPGFKGIAAFDASMGNSLLYANVEYAVFAPGSYPDDGVLGDDPSNGREYVYAYQAFNSANSNRGLATLSVGIDPSSLVSNAGDDPLAGIFGGQSPALVYALGQSVIFDFAPELPKAKYSTVLLYTSPYPPTWGPGSIQSGGLSDQETVPTPVPEPTSCVLFGLLCVLRRR
jgi:hypothetical protein